MTTATLLAPRSEAEPAAASLAHAMTTATLLAPRPEAEPTAASLAHAMTTTTLLAAGTEAESTARTASHGLTATTALTTRAEAEPAALTSTTAATPGKPMTSATGSTLTPAHWSTPGSIASAKGTTARLPATPARRAVPAITPTHVPASARACRSAIGWRVERTPVRRLVAPVVAARCGLTEIATTVRRTAKTHPGRATAIAGITATIGWREERTPVGGSVATVIATRCLPEITATIGR
jgi:hypothetical protein